VLQCQLLKMLTALVDGVDGLVARDGVQQQVWRDEVLVDFEHSLNKLVTKLSRALAGAALVGSVLPGRTVSLPGGTHRIRREPAAAVRIKSEDGLRRHLFVTVRGRDMTICDVSGTTRSSVNGSRVTDAGPLQDGNHMVVCDVSSRSRPPPQGRRSARRFARGLSRCRAGRGVRRRISGGVDSSEPRRPWRLLRHPHEALRGRISCVPPGEEEHVHHRQQTPAKRVV
jgi:hypothetical protein